MGDQRKAYQVMGRLGCGVVLGLLGVLLVAEGVSMETVVVVSVIVALVALLVVWKGE